jgi:drug/metabolite transporter (DMT)-like permease
LDTRSKYIIGVMTSALIVAFEAVAVEGAINTAHLTSLIVASVPQMIGGTILMLAYPRGTSDFARGLGQRGWLFMMALCAMVAGGVFMWFDAVGRIGASKEAILGGGSSEVLFVVLLSAVFLSERLNRWEILGSFLVLGGVFLVLANTETLQLTLGIGEIEAIVSSLMLAISIIMTTKLLRSHDLTPLSGVELFVSGLILVLLGTAIGVIKMPDVNGALVLLGLGVFPSVSLLAYNAGLPQIGESLTSVLFALNGVMTVGAQLLILFLLPKASLILPQNLGLAVLGGLIAFSGVYLLYRPGAGSVKPPERPL